jgi:hypothetical protein
MVPGELRAWTSSTITRASVPTPPTGAVPGNGVGDGEGDGDGVGVTLGVGVGVGWGLIEGGAVELQPASTTVSSTARIPAHLPTTGPFW